MNHVEKKELNNKGFSLMELIIVVAIMAVLIGVLAPQYLKYVEKSRQSADLQGIDTLVSAVEIYSAGTVVEGTLKCADGKVTTTGNVGEALTDAGIETGDGGVVATMKSDTYSLWVIGFSASEVAASEEELATALSIKHDSSLASAGGEADPE